MDLEDDVFMDSPDIGLTATNPATATKTTTPLQSLNSLPFNRRDMDQWNNEFCTAVEYEPKQINLFDQPPAFDLNDSNDNESIQQLKEYFTTKFSRKRQLIDAVNNNTEMSGHHIKKQLCHIDLGYLQAEQLKFEIEKLREEFSLLTSQTQMLHKENGALKTRLSKYEVTDVIDRQRTQDAKNNAKKKDAALEKQRQVLQQVGNALDERRPGGAGDGSGGAVATLRKQFDFKENGTKSATIPRKPASTRPPRYPPSVTTISTSSSSSYGSNGGSPVYANTRSQTQHRRSQSVATPHRSRK